MASLYDRELTLQVGTLGITGLRVSFRVTRTLFSEPNTAEISVWNLSENSRAQVQVRGTRISLSAGYRGTSEVLFSGNIRKATTTRVGADVVTRIQAGDGETAYRTARVNESLAPGTTVADALSTLGKSLGIGLGNVKEKASEGGWRGKLTEWTNGLTLSGKSSEELDKLTRSLGLEWSIQDGELQVLRSGERNRDAAVLLTSDSGLIGSPEVGDLGVVNVTSLLQPGLRPGRAVDLRSEFLRGLYRVQKVTHSGDTHGAAWHSTCEMRPL